jgi:hypothetical protein
MSALPCGCCEGITVETPATIDNRPGLSAVSYRSGTWAQFNASMLDALSTTPALAGLQTRSDDDFTIALLDAWAVVCDILTFYQERIANESYLRTATELVSVGELAKLIGYKLRPGLAATAALSFTMDTPLPVAPAPSNPPSGSPTSIALATGTKTQTVPDPGAQPATFETVAPICARAEWNAIAPRTRVPPASGPGSAASNVRLKGLVGTIKAGDSLLVVATEAPNRPQLQRVMSIEQDTKTQTTLVHFEGDFQPAAAEMPTTPGVAAAGASLDDDFLWASVKGCQWQDQTQLVAFATAQGWSIDALEDGINALRQSLAPGASPPLTVYAMGTDASLFGHNAQDWNTLPQTPKPPPLPDWNGYTLQTITTTTLPWVDLDNVYAVFVGAQVVLEDES